MKRKIIITFLVLIFLFICLSFSNAQQLDYPKQSLQHLYRLKSNQNLLSGDSLNVRMIAQALYGPCHCSFIQGNYAYIGAGRALLILDISNPSNPILISYLHTPRTIFDICIKNNYLYLADGYGGLRVIDISNKIHPKEIGFWGELSFWDRAVGIDINGNYAYLVVGKLYIIDISNPFKPDLIGSYKAKDRFDNVVVSGDYAYVADSDSGLQIIDISNPANPTEVASYVVGSAVNDVAIDYPYVYVAAYFGLYIIDVSDPYQPIEVGNCDPWGFEFAVVVKGIYAYLAVSRRIKIIDISDPTQPVEIGSCYTGEETNNVSINGNHAYVAADYDGLRIINVENPTQPTEVGFFHTGYYARAIFIYDNYAYVSEGYGGLRILNISNPSQPIDMGYYDYEGETINSVAICANYAYAATSEGLRIIDVSNPNNPIEAGLYNTNHSAADIALSSNYAYIIDGEAEILHIIDISDPTHPNEISLLNMNDNNWNTRFTAISISNNKACISCAASGIRIVDISDPYQSTEIGHSLTNDFAADLEIKGNYAYVADSNSGLCVIDISNPSQPNIVVTYDTYHACGITINGNYAFIADWSHGIRVINISNPFNPTEVGYYEKDIVTSQLDVSGEYIFADDWYGGIYILQFLGVPPEASTLFQPANNSSIKNNTPTLTWNVPTDFDGDPLHFKVEIAIDINFTNQIAGSPFESQNNPNGFNPFPPVAEGSDTCSFTVQSPLIDGDYWWRVNAWDGKAYSEPSEEWKFTIDATKPYTADHNPAKDATDVHVNTNIVVHIKDDLSGVDISTIVMKVNLVQVAPTITGDANDVTLIYDPPGDFDYDQRVTVIVAAKDIAGNEMDTDYYSFYTEKKPQKPAFISIVPHEHGLHEVFNVDIKVREVENLHGLSFVFNYPQEHLDYQSSEPGDFLGSDVLFNPIYPTDGQLPIAVTKKGEQLGANGSGIVALIKLQEKTSVPSGVTINLFLTDVAALDPSGNAITLTPMDTSYITAEAPNTAPNAPQLVSPANNDNPGTNQPTLTWNVPSDADSDSLHFKVEIATDNNFNSQIFGSPFESHSNPGYFSPTPPVAEGSGNCSFAMLFPLVDSDYWWRVTAWDGKAYGDVSSIWKFTIGITSVENEKHQLPKEYALYNNYPNPFNPTTTISYALPQSCHIRLQIFALNGRLVRTLVNAQQESGTHSVPWDAKNDRDTQLASGIYICRLSAGTMVLHQKLILTK